MVRIGARQEPVLELPGFQSLDATEIEIADIAGEVRALCKGRRIASEDGEMRVEAASAMGVAEAFDEPAVEEAGAAGQEEATAAGFAPQTSRWRLRSLPDRRQGDSFTGPG
jgi:hypothetical protein